MPTKYPSRPPRISVNTNCASRSSLGDDRADTGWTDATSSVSQIDLHYRRVPLTAHLGQLLRQRVEAGGLEGVHVIGYRCEYACSRQFDLLSPDLTQVELHRTELQARHVRRQGPGQLGDPFEQQRRNWAGPREQRASRHPGTSSLRTWPEGKTSTPREGQVNNENGSRSQPRCHRVSVRLAADGGVCVAPMAGM